MCFYFYFKDFNIQRIKKNCYTQIYRELYESYICSIKKYTKNVKNFNIYIYEQELSIVRCAPSHQIFTWATLDLLVHDEVFGWLLDLEDVSPDQAVDDVADPDDDDPAHCAAHGQHHQKLGKHGYISNILFKCDSICRIAHVTHWLINLLTFG